MLWLSTISSVSHGASGPVADRTAAGTITGHWAEFPPSDLDWKPDWNKTWPPDNVTEVIYSSLDEDFRDKHNRGPETFPVLLLFFEMRMYHDQSTPTRSIWVSFIPFISLLNELTRQFGLSLVKVKKFRN